MAEEHIELRFSVDSAVRIFHIMESKDCLVSLIQTNLHASHLLVSRLLHKTSDWLGQS